MHILTDVIPDRSEPAVTNPLDTAFVRYPSPAVSFGEFVRDRRIGPDAMMKVIRGDNLHPRLRDCVDYIAYHGNAGKNQALAWNGMLVAACGLGFGLFVESPGIVLAGVLYGGGMFLRGFAGWLGRTGAEFARSLSASLSVGSGFYEDRVQQHKRIAGFLGERVTVDFLAPVLMFTKTSYLWQPYREARHYIKRLPQLISQILAEGGDVFPGCDTKRILESYRYGEIDESGNLYLTNEVSVSATQFDISTVKLPENPQGEAL